MRDRSHYYLLFVLSVFARLNSVILQETIQYSQHQTDPRQRTVIMRLEPVYIAKAFKNIFIFQLPDKPPFLNQMDPPRAILQSNAQSHISQQKEQEFKSNPVPQSQQLNRVASQQKVNKTQYRIQKFLLN